MPDQPIQRGQQLDGNGLRRSFGAGLEQVQLVVELGRRTRRIGIQRQPQRPRLGIHVGQAGGAAVEQRYQFGALLAQQRHGQRRLARAVGVAGKAVGHVAQHLARAAQAAVGVAGGHVHGLQRLVAVGGGCSQLGHDGRQLLSLQARLTEGQLQARHLLGGHADGLREFAGLVGGVDGLASPGQDGCDAEGRGERAGHTRAHADERGFHLPRRLTDERVRLRHLPLELRDVGHQPDVEVAGLHVSAPFVAGGRVRRRCCAPGRPRGRARFARRPPTAAGNPPRRRRAWCCTSRC